LHPRGRDADTPLHIVAEIVEPGTVIMIVDDDEAIRQGVTEILVTEGYEVRPAPSGEAALAEIGLGVTPSVVILDLWLPGIGSSEFARRLRARFQRRVPILVLSAWPSLHRLALDADHVLPKPSDAAAIARAVDKLAARGAVELRRGPSRAPTSMENRQNRLRGTR
jgi:DNA-binding response OmpR family regulator